MKRNRKILVTLTIGTVMTLAAHAAPVSAGNREAGTTMSGTIHQAAIRDGIPDGAEPGKEENSAAYTYRNTWNHRNVRTNRYCDRWTVAASGQGRGFVDENGDGINDLAPDFDGDGIPNGQDPDWVKNKRDGTGYKHGLQSTDRGRRCGGSQSRGSRGAQTAR